MTSQGQETWIWNSTWVCWTPRPMLTAALLSLLESEMRAMSSLQGPLVTCPTQKQHCHPDSSQPLPSLPRRESFPNPKSWKNHHIPRHGSPSASSLPFRSPPHDWWSEANDGGNDGGKLKGNGYSSFYGAFIYFIYFLFLIEFIEVTLVNKIT